MLLQMLIENERYQDELHVEHGIALYMEIDGTKLLFDTGASGDFIDNAMQMGIILEDIDYIVISHAHSDHTGGLPHLLEINQKAPVLMSGRARGEYYSQELFSKENISPPDEIFTKYLDRIRFINDFTELEENIHLVTKFFRKYPLPRSNKDLLVKLNGKFEQDHFDHELALVVNNGGKLVIVTGCSHNGVDNMIEVILGCFPGVPIQTVIGGFHLIGFPFHRLMGEKKKKIETLGKMLLNYGIEKTFTCHCSGSWGYNVLKETMGDRIEYFSTGMQVEL